MSPRLVAPVDRALLEVVIAAGFVGRGALVGDRISEKSPFGPPGIILGKDRASDPARGIWRKIEHLAVLELLSEAIALAELDGADRLARPVFQRDHPLLYRRVSQAQHADQVVRDFGDRLPRPVIEIGCQHNRLPDRGVEWHFTLPLLNRT